MNSYLEQQAAHVTESIELIPSEPFTSRCVYRENEPARGKPRRTEFEPPDISLRDYHDVVVAPGQVISDDRVIFPDTYRHNARHRLTNRFTEEVGPAVRATPVRLDEVEALAGAYFHLDNEVRGHFGHLLTEQLSRLWAWPEAKAARAGPQAAAGHQPSGRGAALRVHGLRRRGCPSRGRGPAAPTRAGREGAVRDADVVQPRVRAPPDRRDVATGGRQPGRDRGGRSTAGSGLLLAPIEEAIVHQHARSRNSSEPRVSRSSTRRTCHSETRSRPCGAPTSSPGSLAAGCSTCASWRDPRA